jgi:hypothetical protein
MAMRSSRAVRGEIVEGDRRGRLGHVAVLVEGQLDRVGGNTTITKIYDPSGNAMTLTNYYVRKPLPVDANGNAKLCEVKLSKVTGAVGLVMLPFLSKVSSTGSAEP